MLVRGRRAEEGVESRSTLRPLPGSRSWCGPEQHGGYLSAPEASPSIAGAAEFGVSLGGRLWFYLLPLPSRRYPWPRALKYHAENRNITLGEYKFGPLFMRLCYELDLEDSAVELIKDQHLRGFFSDSTSFNILMDMLFIKGKYKSALEVLIEMKNQDLKFNKDTYVLAFAICYKLNSPESFQICTTLREEALIKGEILSRRASCFAVALALNQNQLAKAISIFSQIMNPESIICTNLNIMIHIQSNMLKTLIDILKDATEGNLSRFVKRPVFSEEVLVKVREKVKDVPALLAKFDELNKKLHINGQVTEYTLDALLCHTPSDRQPHTVLLNKRTVSRRTFQPLSQSLWAE
ncbi:PTCD2 [Cervus elaphus hippelaphus]|uniref:Pentatricopeptide repeat-containing protein 2, mitochondrial n=1 Tax=Cervus elaphus hippelaphus TaxID=46360 RepID=A0A212C8M9_CEREH|nr:PTCD2 [Cervus elaphus hippelaphus]